MLERFGVARQLDMDDEAEAGQVDPARGNVGRHAHPRPAVAQRLQRAVAFGLAVFARQGDGGKAALDQAGMQMAHRIARRAEQHRRIGIVEAQQVDDRMFDIGRGDRNRLMVDIAMPARLAHRRDAQRVALVTLGERGNRLGHGGRKQQGTPPLGRRVENLLQILAKAHVEHLVGFVEHGDAQRRQVERPALEMIAQPPRRADDDVRAGIKRAPLARRIHAAHTRRDPRPGLAVQPFQLARDLQRQFARGRDHQRKRRARLGQPRGIAEQICGHGKAEGNGLARPGLGGDQQVAAGGLRLENGGLDGGGGGIAARDKRLAKRGRKIRKGHERFPMGDMAARHKAENYVTCPAARARPAARPLAQAH